MKDNNKKVVLGSALALALSVGMLAPNLTKADEDTNVSETEAVETNDVDGNAGDQETGEKPEISEDSNEIATDDNLSNAKKEAIEELKEAGITSDIYFDQINKANTIEGVEALKNETLKAHEDSKETATDDNLSNAKKEAIGKLKEAGITSDIYFDQINKANTIEGVEALKNEILKAHENKEEDPEEEITNGFDTRREAEIAAEKALENDPVNKSYTISQGSDGKYYYTLSPAEEGIEIGYETREEAEAAAKEALENDQINNSYEISQGSDGRYYYKLTYKEEEVEEPENPGITIDEWLLENAKKEAIEELKEAGITSDIYFDQINKAKTVEGVEALKNEILKAHKGETPEKPDKTPEEPDKTPDEPENHGEPGNPENPKDPEGTDKGHEGNNGSGEGKEDEKEDDGKKVEENTKSSKIVNKNNKGNNNVNTGVAGLTGVVAALTASAAALFKSKRK